MIAHAFPPEGAAGVYRPLRFVRHLPSFGWQPTVITLDTDAFERYDPSLLSQVPKEVEVIRVRNLDPWQAFQARRSRRIQKQLTKASAEQTTRILSAQQNPMRSRARELVRSIEARVYHPDIAMGWIAPAARAIQQACKRTRPDVIWATAGPVSSFHVAAKVSRRTGVPYVLDFRDAWTITFNEFEARRPRWATLRDWRNLFRLLSGAQSVIFRSHTDAECYYRAYHGALEPVKIHILPNGFEGEVESFDPTHGEKCEFLYTGTLSEYRYETLLQAICFLKTFYPVEAAQMHFHFVGEGTEIIGKRADTLGLKDVITTEGAISQSAVVELSKKAHALLLLGRPAVMKGYELFAAAKLFGYLKAGRPIVGILPPDEAKQILQKVGSASTVADVDSRDEIIAVLRRVLRDWASCTLRSLVPDANVCRNYSAESQTRALVAALAGTPAHDPFVPGRVDIPDSLREEISRREEISWKESSWRGAKKKYLTEANVKTVIPVPKSRNS